MTLNTERSMVVASCYQLTPNMQRVVFTGEQFVGFPAGQGSGYIKRLLPNVTGSVQPYALTSK